MMQSKRSCVWRRATLFVLLAGLMLTGCAMMEDMANMGVKTAGEHPIAKWHATDFRAYTVGMDEREIYEFILVLEEARGRTVTFTRMDARFMNNRHSRELYWDKEGSWTLPAHGELRLPLGSYRYCHVENCRDWGPLGPLWHLTLTGTDEGGEPVQMKLKLQLPYTDNRA
ncbi:MAG: hypothetical protein OEU26_26440 [Candidatus Tectomicrobia bacterium]|nr:hypothetical protein [Candidatus Tectomicrobia bacterium]